MSFVTVSYGAGPRDGSRCVPKPARFGASFTSARAARSWWRTGCLTEGSSGRRLILLNEGGSRHAVEAESVLGRCQAGQRYHARVAGHCRKRRVAWAKTTDNLTPTLRGPGTPSFQACYKSNDGSGFPCQTDNRNVYYTAQKSLERKDRKNVIQVMKSQFSPTDLVRHYVHRRNAKYHGKGETDIIYQEGPVPDGLVGYTGCNDPVSTYRCDQQYVRIKGAGPYHRDGLVCHETGHAVGLTHGEDAYPSVSNQRYALRCMRDPVYDYNDILGSNNKQNINETY